MTLTGGLIKNKIEYWVGGFPFNIGSCSVTRAEYWVILKEKCCPCLGTWAEKRWTISVQFNLFMKEDAPMCTQKVTTHQTITVSQCFIDLKRTKEFVLPAESLHYGYDLKKLVISGGRVGTNCQETVPTE
ncbi:conserved hypothetical protein [Ricinus communis]|uniref:Uncharacterized protein n=1 Tax=Ricinus communis TaxID=3988 RepID=B9RIL6_RICCO|nr:conserved hypothetical protein [Ricinus communis]